MSRRSEVAIVGGGVAGLASAIGVRLAGLDPFVFERDAASRGRGGPLWLPANAVRSLKALGVLESVVPLCTELVRYSVRDSRGALILELPVRKLASKYGAPLLAIPRRHLLSALAAQIPPGHLIPDAHCTGFTADSGRGLRVRVGDRADTPGAGPFVAVIGGDGVGSVVREQLHGKAPRAPVGGWVYTGIADAASSCGRRVGEAELRVGPGATFLSLPMGPASGEPSAVAWWAAWAGADPGRVMELVELGPSVAGMMAASDRSTWMRFPIRARRGQVSVGYGQVTLVGDASHAMTPALGQGASQAIEGAAVLARCLREQPRIETAFRNFERERTSRVLRISRFSNLLGLGLVQPVPDFYRRWLTWSALPMLYRELDFMFHTKWQQL